MIAVALVARRLKELSELPRSDLKLEYARDEAYCVWLTVYFASRKRKERPTTTPRARLYQCPDDRKTHMEQITYPDQTQRV